MSRDPEDLPGGARGSARPTPPGAQGASRGGVRPDDAATEDQERPNEGSRSSSGAGRRARAGDDDAPLGGYPFGGRQSRSDGWRENLGWNGPRFLGMPLAMVYALGAAIIGLVFVGAICSSPSKPGTVAGQVLGYNADRTLTSLAGAELTLRGSGQTYAATSTQVAPGSEGEAAYNYRFENVPPGTYALSVTPPPGSTYQPEENLTFKVESGQLFPQSVMLLAQGVQKPRQLAANELQPGEAGGYINDRGERVVYRQGGGFDASDALLMYLLWRNPPGWGYGAPPVIVNSPSGSSTSSSYRVADPPSSSRTGQTVTQQKPSTPGQGSTRPSGSTGVTGAGPNTGSSSSSGTSSGDAVAPAQTNPSSGSSSSGANTSTQTKPSTSTSAGSSTTTRPNTPSQGTTRPSSSTSRPSTSSAPSRSSGGGRR